MARYVFCDEHMTFEPKGEDCPGKKEFKSRLMIFGDLPPFISSVDGKEISGRAALREHNKRHGVTHASDFTNEWKNAAAERAKVFQGKNDRQERAAAIAEAIHKVRNR